MGERPNPAEIVRRKLSDRKAAYKAVFRDGAVSDVVLHDLATFCRATESTFREDPRAHALLEGRREVYLRIMEMCNLSDEEYWEKYRRRGMTDE